MTGEHMGWTVHFISWMRRRAIEDMAVELIFGECIGFCKEWEKVIRGRGNSGSKEHAWQKGNSDRSIVPI